MSNQSRFFKGFVIGALVGVIGGILYAPKSGEETRETLKKVKQDKFGEDQTESLVAKTLDAIDQGFERLSHMIGEKKAKKKNHENDIEIGTINKDKA